MNAVICDKCEREIQEMAPVSPMPVVKADSIAVSWLLLTLRQFTYTPMQAKHLMVMLRGQTRGGSE